MATTYTVDDTGGGTHLTIAAALAVVVSGDTILVTDGQAFLEHSLSAPGVVDLTIKRTPGKGFADNLAGDSPPIMVGSFNPSAITVETGWLVEGLLLALYTSHVLPSAVGATDFTLRWVSALSSGGLSDGGGNGCKAENCIIDTCVGEAYACRFIGTSGNLIRSFVVKKTEGKLAAGLLLTSGGVVERCLWVDGDAAAASDFVVEAELIRNTIVHNPGTGVDGLHAGPGGYHSCCVNLDDPVRTPYDGFVAGAPPSTCIEEDPIFPFGPSSDYHLGLGSPCRGTGSPEFLTVVSPPIALPFLPTTDLDGDGHGRWARNDMGPYASMWSSAFQILRAITRGTHLVDLIALSPSTHAFWRPAAESAHRWFMFGNPFASPEEASDPLLTRVARATIDPVDDRILHLRTDVPMLEGVVYFPLFDSFFSLGASAPLFGTLLEAYGADFLLNGPDPPLTTPPTVESDNVADEGQFWVQGGRVSRPAPEEEAAIFQDFDAPIFDDTGSGFGKGWLTGDDGQYKLVGGAITVIKIVWATLLTHKGELTHDPNIGTRLRVKEPLGSIRDEERFLASQLRGIPFVQEARVTITQPAANTADVAVEVVTELGLIRTRREVPRSVAR